MPLDAQSDILLHEALFQWVVHELVWKGKEVQTHPGKGRLSVKANGFIIWTLACEDVICLID